MGADRIRRLLALSACLTFSVVVLIPAAALAAPTVTLNPRAVPIPKSLWEPATGRT